MNRDELRAVQAPLKDAYREDARAASITLHAEGALLDGIACSVEAHGAMVRAGLHEATGGTGTEACSGDMLLQALVACAGVTLRSVATAMGIEVSDGRVAADGDLDFRGTLGLGRDIPVGFSEIRLSFELETDADPETLAKLLEVTERYCVVLQTLRSSPTVEASVERSAASR